MREEKAPPGAWKAWLGDSPLPQDTPLSQARRGFLFLDWCCEWAVYWLRRWAFVELLEIGGRLAILVSVVTFAWNYSAVRESQKKAKHYQAWQVINLAHGKPGSGGRADALADLVKDGVSLAFIDLPRATLDGADLQGADLFKANLQEAKINSADLQGANLLGANLEAAELEDANLEAAILGMADLRGADLRASNLRGANLRFANLQLAILYDADLQEANLQEAKLGSAVLLGAKLQGANLREAHLEYANLQGTNLRGANNVTCEQLRQANLWQDAYRDEALACGAPIPPPPEQNPQ